jgi:hypothetical protein
MRPSPPAEKMENVIFKVGPKKNITVCVSFFPKDSGIDDLFDDALSVLCSDTGMTKEEFSSRYDLEAAKLQTRIVAAKKLILRNMEESGDVYEVVDNILDSTPALKELYEGDEAIQRRKSREIDLAEVLASHENYSRAIDIFIRFMKDNNVRLRVFLCKLVSRDAVGAKKILDGTEDDNYIYSFMTFLYDCYVRKDFTRFVNQLSTYSHGLEDETFILIMLLRLKAYISETD